MYTVFNDYESTQQPAIISESKPKEIITVNRPENIDISRERLSSYLEEVFAKYRIENQVEIAKKVIEAESGWNVFAVGDDGVSNGLLQYQRETWDENCVGYYMNPYHQIDCLGLMVSKGMWNRWTAYRNLIK